MRKSGRVQNDLNKFNEDYTYVNCNNIISCDIETFTKLLNSKSIIRLDGQLSDEDMELIRNGVKVSVMVPDDIKVLF